MIRAPKPENYHPSRFGGNGRLAFAALVRDTERHRRFWTWAGVAAFVAVGATLAWAVSR